MQDKNSFVEMLCPVHSDSFWLTARDREQGEICTWRRLHLPWLSRRLYQGLNPSDSLRDHHLAGLRVLQRKGGQDVVHNIFFPWGFPNTHADPHKDITPEPRDDRTDPQVSCVSPLALNFDLADGEINIIMHDYQALALAQVAPHQGCHTLSTSIHIRLGLDAQHHIWSDLPFTAKRLGLALSHSNTIALSKRINDVKTKIMSCMVIALARVAQPNNHIRRYTIISQH